MLHVHGWHVSHRQKYNRVLAANADMPSAVRAGNSIQEWHRKVGLPAVLAAVLAGPSAFQWPALAAWLGSLASAHLVAGQQRHHCGSH